MQQVNVELDHGTLYMNENGAPHMILEEWREQDDFFNFTAVLDDGTAEEIAHSQYDLGEIIAVRIDFNGKFEIEVIDCCPGFALTPELMRSIADAALSAAEAVVNGE